MPKIMRRRELTSYWDFRACQGNEESVSSRPRLGCFEFFYLKIVSGVNGETAISAISKLIQHLEKFLRASRISVRTCRQCRVVEKSQHNVAGNEDGKTLIC